jgi:predicted transposase YdaD
MNELAYQSHDNFFRGTFGIPEVAREHIVAFFPKDVLAKMDLENMTLDPTAYVSDALSGHYSDLVWQIPYGKNKKSEIKVALLFEHKTKGSNEVYFQLLRYMVEVWEQCKTDKKERLIVIPFVYFLGNAKGDTADIIYNIKLKSQHPPNFMSALDVLIARGEQAGREEGMLIGEALGKAEGKAEAVRQSIQKAILQGKLTDAEIAEDNDTTLEYVQQVRTEIDAPPAV